MNQIQNPSHFNRLLVIDDNEAIHNDFRKIFSASAKGDALRALDAELFGIDPARESTTIDYELSFASQGKDGFELVKESVASGLHFGVAFVDMRMPPGWDGVETIEHLWKADPDLQVVICTAYSDRSWNDITQRLGLTDQLLILKKPFDEVEVVQLTASLTKKRELLAESQLRMEHLERVVVDQDAEIEAAHKDAEHLISSITSALISTDESGVVARWNPAAEEVFGLFAREAIGSRFEELPIRWTNCDELTASLRACSLVQQKQRELQFVDNGGTTKTLLATICPILNDPTTKARLILATDVTNQKAMQSQLDQSQRLESVGQLAAGVAHEINTPMQYIGDNVRFVAKSFTTIGPALDCLSALVDPNVTPEQLQEAQTALAESLKPRKLKSVIQQIPEALADSIGGVEAVSKIVGAMKEFSHPGTNQKVQVCLNHVLDSTVTVASNEWKYVADVHTDFQPNLAAIDALPSDLNQAFLNIIVNASHAIAERVKKGEITKGLIEVKSEAIEGYVKVTIKDNGGGIPSAVRHRVFEPFFTTKDVGKGTGQGLAIAFSVIVQKHGGRLTFDVEDGVGTTFIIELPLTDPSADLQPESVHELHEQV